MYNLQTGRRERGKGEREVFDLSRLILGIP
jgi:hypothetical protein